MPYYVSATEGKITSTKPTNPNYVNPIGLGMSATELYILLAGFPIIGAGG